MPRRPSCQLCGAALPPRQSSGRPWSYCPPFTGRECRKLAKRLREVEGLAAGLLQAAERESDKRQRQVRWRLRFILADIRRHL